MQFFYYSHIFGAAIFMVFGTMHHNHTWTYAAAGLVIYGIDVAYRLYQTSLPVTVDISCSGSGNMISVRVPVTVCHHLLSWGVSQTRIVCLLRFQSMILIRWNTLLQKAGPAWHHAYSA
jgi:hypothetical protein